MDFLGQERKWNTRVRIRLPDARSTPKLWAMFTVDEPTAAAIRRAYEEDGDLASIVEFRRHFPLINDNAKARECVRTIVSWTPLPGKDCSQPSTKRPAQKSRTLR